MKALLLPLLLVSVLQTASAQIQWTQRTDHSSVFLTSIASGSSGFVIGGEQATVKSVDGITWNSPNFISGSIIGVANANGIWLAIAGGDNLYSSTDMQTWTLRLNVSNAAFESLCYGNGLVVLGNNSGVLRQSTDYGITWTIVASPTSDRISSIAYGNGLFVAVTQGGQSLSSPDGVAWTLRGNLNVNPSGVAYGNGRFVTVGGLGAAYSSDNGVTWIKTLNPPSSLRSVAYANGQFVAVGDSGTIYSSSNLGSSWSAQNSGVTFSIAAIAAGNGVFVAVGSSGGIITSPTASTPPLLVPTVNLSQAMKLQWQSTDGVVYQVQVSSDLQNWSNTGTPIQGDGLSKSFFDGTAGATSRFYRIQMK